MATQRYISTSFWDDAWVQSLDPSEKLFYIYLLTNPLTNIAGVYKITDRRVSFDTGFSDEVVAELWMRFTRLNKAIRFHEWVIIPTWPKHQRWQDRKTIKAGIDKILAELPENVTEKLHDVHYSYPMDKVLGPMHMSSEDPSYLDADTDSDTDAEPDTSAAAAPVDNFQGWLEEWLPANRPKVRNPKAFAAKAAAAPGEYADLYEAYEAACARASPAAPPPDPPATCEVCGSAELEREGATVQCRNQACRQEYGLIRGEWRRIGTSSWKPPASDWADDDYEPAVGG